MDVKYEWVYADKRERFSISTRYHWGNGKDESIALMLINAKPSSIPYDICPSSVPWKLRPFMKLVVGRWAGVNFDFLSDSSVEYAVCVEYEDITDIVIAAI